MNVLVVDDQRSARHVLSKILAGISGVEVVQAASLEEARRAVREHVLDVALIDLRLSDDMRNRDGLILVAELIASTSIAPVVVSGHADVSDFRDAFRAGAVDYLIKDGLCDELVRPLLENIRMRRRLETEVEQLRARVGGVPSNLVGVSPAMEQVRVTIRRVAASDRPVLVVGPTGAGKELVVQAIHALGASPAAPLLDLNCSALPNALLESQLFGHEKGAFTGADTRQAGYFAAVGTGTLFLDEVAELELGLQPKLLRVLESRRFRAVGSVTEQEFRGRIVAATHVDLSARVAEKRFREDLFYRLNVLTVRVPSLSERREDIPLLVAHFVAKSGRALKYSDAALSVLAANPWPGNVRQLRNVVDRLSVMCETECVEAADVQAALDVAAGRADDVLRQLARAVLALGDGDKLELVGRALVSEALAMTDDNKSAAARALGVHRKVVERWAKPD